MYVDVADWDVGCKISALIRNKRRQLLMWV